MSSELQLDVIHVNRWRRHLVNAYEVNTQTWQEVMAAYRRGNDLTSHLLADFVHRYQFLAQRSVVSTGGLYLFKTITKL